MVQLVQDAYTGKMLNRSRCTQGFTIRPQIRAIIQKSIPTFGLDNWIVNWKLEEFKLQHTQAVLKDPQLAKLVREHDTLSDDIAKSLLDEAPSLTLTDKVADFASSHRFGLFIISLV